MDAKFSIKTIVLLSALTTILFVQEQLLIFLPNIQLTVMLIVLYSKTLGMKKTVIIVVIYSLLDCLITASLNLLYFPALLIGWIIIPVTLNTVFKRITKPFHLALLGILYSLLYSWIFIIPTILLTEVKCIPYLIADLPFEILLCCSSFLTILWLYQPLEKVIKDLYIKKEA